MPFLYNVHTPQKTFALQHKDGEEYPALISRIATKAGLSKEDATALREGKDGAGLVYEFEGSRWSLEDDDDLQIFFSRLPPSSSSSATFHLTPPHPHARFSLPTSTSNSNSDKPSTNTAASALKDKTRSPVKPKSAKPKAEPVQGGGGIGSDGQQIALKDYGSGNEAAAGTQGRELGGHAAPKSPSKSKSPKAKANGSSNGMDLAPSHHFPKATHAGNPGVKESDALSRPLAGEKKEVIGHTEGNKNSLQVPSGRRSGKAASVWSTRSRRSKWGDDDAEPLWEVKKRAWNEDDLLVQTLQLDNQLIIQFHNGNGVRTVTGKVGDVENVRMLLKPGHKGVYISRTFAMKHGLVAKNYSMGGAGYTGLKSIGSVSITVAGKTAQHPAMVSEEAHFDVTLGRTWVEKMNVKVDPIDQTNLTYMDSGDAIPCDIVVLKDSQGNKIHLS